MEMNLSPRKRKAESLQDEQHQSKKSSEEVHSTLVANHYNKRGNTSCAERRNSKIYYMRNFNNWIKSVLIKKYLDKLRDKELCQRPIVLDLGVGKGGDLLKWDKGHIDKLICTDIAETSINQCKERYATLQKRTKSRRIFDAEFIVADSGRVSLHEKFSDKNLKLDITSCQFVIHYTFESEMQADTMVRNACHSLKDGGYFIGTTINDNKVVNMVKNSKTLEFGNSVYSIEFQTRQPFPEFGCKYRFKLHDVVDCPEFLLHKHSLIRICKKYNMKLVEWTPFSEFFSKHCDDRENFRLIRRMQALEIYPPHNTLLNSSVDGDYNHAKTECDRLNQRYPGSNPRVATLSKTEWEAASIYVVFAFVKDEQNIHNTKEEENESAIQEDKIPLVIL